MNGKNLIGYDVDLATFKSKVKVFYACGYYADDPNVLIEATNKGYSLYNKMYDALVEDLKVKNDGNKYLEVKGMKYYLNNFVPNNDILNIQA